MKDLKHNDFIKKPIVTIHNYRMIQVRLIICLLFFFFCACKEQNNETKEIQPATVKEFVELVNNDQLNDFIGQYEYKKTDNPKENLFLILNKVDTQSISNFEGYSWEEKNEKGEVVEKSLTGLFYGNTDLFEESREGHSPGFFVVNVQVEPAEENRLKVTVNIDSPDVFENPVQPPVTTAKEALQKGNKKWKATENAISKELLFEVKKSKELLLKSDLGLEDKILKKTN